MTETFEFELVFGLPDGDHDPFLLSDAVFSAGFEDAVIGTGHPRLLGVELEMTGASAEDAILDAARTILKKLPLGSELREVRPDLVSLADVAEKMNIKRQALQKRKELPLPGMGGLYRIDELADILMNPVLPGDGRRKARTDARQALNWFSAGKAARKLNAQLTMQLIDPKSMEKVVAEE